jgi:uridine kinase
MRKRPRTQSNADLPEEELLKEVQQINEEVDFDDPKTIDFDLLIKLLAQLKQNKPFNMPVYDKFLKIRTEKMTKIFPHPVIIVEGCLIFCNAELRELFDLTVWIDTDDDVRLSRRVLKNEEEQGVRKVPLSVLL